MIVDIDDESSKEYKLRLKVQKKFPEFADLVEGLNLDELKGNLTRYAKYREETELARSKDVELKRAKDVVTELNAPYKETVDALKLKMAYINILMEQIAPSAEGSDDGASEEV